MIVSSKKDHKLVDLFFSGKTGSSKSVLFKDLKAAAKSTLEQSGFPTIKNEEYKFTNINKSIIDKIKYHSSPDPIDKLGEKLQANTLINSLDAFLIVRNNGVLDEGLSSVPDEVVSLKEFSALKQEEVHQVGSIEKIDKDAFTALNTALFTSGTWIEIPDGAEIKKPILLVNYVSPDAKGECIHPRTYVRAGKNSQATVIELSVFLSDSTVFVNEVSEWEIASNAHIRHYKIQDGHNAELGASNTSTDMGRDATFTSVLLSLNGDMLRNNLSLNLNDSNCEGNMYGLFLLNGKTHVDNHTNVDHKKPRSESNELYKGILTDKSRGVFNGKIFVRQDAQKTNAFQQNNNILLSEEAILNTKPQLEIWADDVKCSHGCTTGQLDEEALFYLRARGIGKESAKSMLLYAFAGEILDKITDEVFKKYCEKIVHERLGGNN